MAPKIVDKEAKKQEILNAAMQVFAQKGVANTRMTDIAVAAGIGKGTIYEYFRSKDEIFGAAFEYFMQNVDEKLVAALKTERDPVQQLRILIDVSIKSFLEEDEDFIAIMMDFWAEGIRSDKEEIMRVFNLEEFYDRFRAIIAGIIDAGISEGSFRPVDSFTLSSLIIGAMDGIMLQWILNKDNFDMQRVADTLFEILLDGLAA